MQHPIKDTVVSAAVSGSAASISWFSDTLPIMQWCAAAVAILSGAIAVVLGSLKLYSMWKRR